MAAARQDQQPAPRFLGIESLRGLAALAIVAVHARGSVMNGPGIADGLLDELAFGVPVFFVISGFVLYRPHVARRLAGKGPVGVRRFAKRRVVRIVPAYLVMLAVAAVIVPGPIWSIACLVFGQSFTDSGLRESVDAGIGQTWSVAIEMWFYAGLAGLFVFIRLKPTTFAREALLYTVALVGVCILLLPSLLPASPLSGNWLPSLACFLCGFLLAIASAHDLPRLRDIASRPITLLLVAALALLVGAVEPQFFALASVVFAVAVVVTAIGANDQLHSRILLDSRLLTLGTLSYGIYLWHVPLLFTFRGGEESVHGAAAIGLTAVALAVTYAAAAASWRLLEAPLLRRWS